LLYLTKDLKAFSLFFVTVQLKQFLKCIWESKLESAYQVKFLCSGPERVVPVMLPLCILGELSNNNITENAEKICQYNSGGADRPLFTRRL
jgi:hypothetical protein